jgi:hypothetical protein
MAIDQEIQSKVDAYRGNPQQLMQRYQQNQQLVDLLALQKLKSEKEAAARDMQLQMQQQPQTIKQQREAELLNMTKQEMMQQTQGVLQQRQAQQQKNMQQVAQQGLGALANQRPAAPQGAPQGQLMPRMAQGGIVSFQPGGSVDGRITFDQWRRMSRGERQRAGLPVSEIGGQMYFNRFGVGLGLNDPQTGERIQREPSPGSGGRNLGRTGVTPEPIETAPIESSRRFSRGRNRGITGVTPEPIETAPIIERLVDQEAAPTDAPQGAIAPVGIPPVTQAPPQAPTLESGLAALAERSDEPFTPSVDPVAAARELASGIGGLGGGGAESAMEQGFARADAYTRREENADRFADMEARLQQFDTERYDPKQERRDQLISFLINARGTTAGSTLASGAAASLRTRDQQNAAARTRLMDQFKMAQEGMQLDMSAAELGMALGREMYAQTMQNQRTVYSALSNMRLEEVRALREQAGREYEQLEKNRAFELDLLQEAREQARLALDTVNTNAGNARQALNVILSTRQAIVEARLASDGTFMQLQEAENIAKAEGDEKEARAAAERRELYYQRIVTEANMLMEAAAQDDPDAMSLLDYESELANAIARGAGINTMDDAMVSPEDIINIQ